MEIFFPHEKVRETQKELIEKIQEVLDKKTNLIAHCPTGVGKCVSGDTRILTEEGLVKIADIYTNKIKLNTLDKNLKVKLEEGIIISKKKSKLYRLTSRTGREIEVTSDHKFLVIENGKLLWKKLKELKIGDFIACPRKLNPIKNKINIYIKDLEKLPEDIKENIAFNTRISLSEIIKNYLTRNKKSIGRLSKESGINEKYLRQIIKNNEIISYENYKLLSKIIEIDLKNEIVEIGTKNRRSRLKVKFNKDFAYFLGLIIGDGHITKDQRSDIEISNIDQEILSFCKNFIKPKSFFKKWGDNCTYIISYKALAYLLILLGIPRGKKAHIVDIPGIFFIDRPLLKEVISGIYDTDGSTSNWSVEITTKSKNLKESLLNALLIFNIYPIIKQKRIKYKNKYLNYYRLYTVDSINNKRFYENIGFKLRRKQEYLKKIINKQTNTNIDLIPNISSLIKSFGQEVKLRCDRANRDHYYRIYESYIYKFRNPSRNSLKKVVEYINNFKKVNSKNKEILELLYNSDIFWDEIKHITYSKKDFVYDATIPSTKNFIGNGIILHNTAAVLSVALSYALENKLTVFFITPKHTQHKIAIETLKLIKQKYNLDINVVDLIGKKWMCAQPSATEMHTTEFYEYCKDLIKNKQCAYFNNLKNKDQLSVETEVTLDELNKKILHVEELRETAKARALCPFEVACLLAKKSTVIIADYHHLLSPGIRENLLERINKSISKCIVIIDEAHNLPSRCRELMSSQLSTVTIDYSIKEAESLGYKEISESIIKIKQIFEKLAATKISNEKKDSLVKKEELIQEIEREIELDQLVNDLVSIGEKTIEIKKRSASLHVANFLMDWQGPDENFSRIINKIKTLKGKEGIMLNYNCLDPSLITKQIADCAYSTICMSGTLTPLEMYKDLFGFKTEIAEFKDPFPKNNKLSIIIPDTTTKFTARSQEMFQQIANYCSMIANEIPGNTAIFFPSYDLRDKINFYFQSQCIKTTFLETPGMTKQEKSELIEKFKSYRESGAVLLGASAGNFGEGIDIEGNILKCVIIVGIPLERPNLETQELINYYEKKFSKGWDYGYIMPAIITCLQNAGRCIRSETDKGIIIFLDQRYIWDSYFKCFPKDHNLRITKEPLNRIKDFFNPEIKNPEQ